jgi:hypothetical protein
VKRFFRLRNLQGNLLSLGRELQVLWASILCRFPLFSSTPYGIYSPNESLDRLAWPVHCPRVTMSMGPETTPVTVSRATQTEDDWSEIKADVKKLVEAVQSLVPPPKPVEPVVSNSEPQPPTQY